MVFIVSSCQQTSSVETLSDEQFVSIYVAMLEQDSLANAVGNSNDSTPAQPAQSVLDGFGVSREMFRAKVESYRENPQKWQTFFEQVTKRLSQRIEKERAKEADSPEENPGQHQELH